MNLKIITAPETEPITLEEAKDHLRVTATDEDTLITSIITVSREIAESFTHRALASQTLEYIIDDFPEEVITLPMPPVESIESIKYKNSEGVETTWDSSKYIFLDSEPAKIVPAYGEVFPSFVPYPIGAVKIRYVAGYKKEGDDPNIIIPEAIKQAILLLIGHYFENREILLERGHIPKTIPFSAEALLYSYKIWS